MDSDSISSFQAGQESKLIDIIRKDSNVCPDPRVSCPATTTCCQLGPDTYGCCPYPDGVCCKDKSHCCPHSMQCDLEHSRCTHSSSDFFTGLFNSLVEPLLSIEKVRLLFSTYFVFSLMYNIVNVIVCSSFQMFIFDHASFSIFSLA